MARAPPESLTLFSAALMSSAAPSAMTAVVFPPAERFTGFGGTSSSSLILATGTLEPENLPLPLRLNIGT